MSIIELKRNINKQLEEMDAEQLKSAYSILKELSARAKLREPKIDMAGLDKQLQIGIEQLDNGEGTSFVSFLKEIEIRYGNKK